MNYYELLIRRSRNTGGGGGESTFSFPDSFSVTDCSYNGAAVGQYSKTSEKTTVNGVDYPVYSMTDTTLGTTFYIFVCDKFNGASGAYWALNGDSEYSSTMDGNNTLGAVSVGSDGLPSSTTWTSANGTATVSWSESTPVIPTDYVRRYLLDGNLKDSKHLDNPDYDLTKPSGVTLSYATILGHMCTKISNGCVYSQNGTGMGITNGGALSIWTIVEGAPMPSGDFKCFANFGLVSAPFAVGYRNGHYAFAYCPSGGNAIISESSVNVGTSFWQLLTLNYDATNKKVQLWISDKLEIEANLTDKLTKGSEIVVNGQNATNGTPDGMPDVKCRYMSLTFFNRTLSPQEIKGLYAEYNQ